MQYDALIDMWLTDIVAYDENYFLGPKISWKRNAEVPFTFEEIALHQSNIIQKSIFIYFLKWSMHPLVHWIQFHFYKSSQICSKEFHNFG